MKSIKEAGNLKGKRVLVRVDWSVPTQNGKIINDYQIRASFPTIHYLREAGAKIILLSHAEKGESDDESLLPIFEYVRDLLPLTFIEQSDLMLMENVRINPGEKENDKHFAKELSKLGDIFVNQEDAKKNLSFLITHGFLHLLGYDHEKFKKDAKKMFELENKILEKWQNLI